MKIEPQILYEQQAFGQGLLKILVATAIVLAVLTPVMAIIEARRRPSSAAGWLAGAAIVAAIVAAVLVGHTAAAMTDTNGLLLAACFHPANIQDVHGAVPLLEGVRGRFPRLEHVFADRICRGKQLVNALPGRGQSRSSSDRTGAMASNFWQGAGLSSAPLHGSADGGAFQGLRRLCRHRTRMAARRPSEAPNSPLGIYAFESGPNCGIVIRVTSQGVTQDQCATAFRLAGRRSAPDCAAVDNRAGLSPLHAAFTPASRPRQTLSALVPSIRRVDNRCHFLCGFLVARLWRSRTSY